MKDEITDDILVEAQLETVDMIVHLGDAARRIGKAIRQFDSGRNGPCEESCQFAEDALEVLERQASDTRIKIKQWRRLLAMEGGAGEPEAWQSLNPRHGNCGRK